jgi:taurine dioxygenase
MIEVRPTGKALGAEIRGVDLSRPLNPSDIQAVLEAWSEHLVLLFRDQFISDPELIRFSRIFGDLDPCPPNALGKQHSEEHLELAIVSNAMIDGEPLGSLGDGELRWHTDMSNHPIPPKASILHALEVSPEGGETEFCNMYAGTYDLPERLRIAIQGKWAHQDGGLDSAGAPHRAVEIEGVRREPPSAKHPLMRLHPDTDRAVLYLGRRPKQYVDGMHPAESDALLDELWAHATQDKYVWTHEWAVGDIIVWDNRCAMHRRNAFPSAARRTLHRTQVTGETVIAA